MKMKYENINEIVEAISSENKRLRTEITRLEESLAWYGNMGVWESGKAQKDRGGRARQALSFGKSEF